MQVNKSLNNIYRYAKKNPEAMSKYAESVESLSNVFADKYAAESTVTEANLRQVIKSPTVIDFIKKIGFVLNRPAVNAELQEYSGKVAYQPELANDIKSQFKFISEFKSGIRKAFRHDPEANNITKELINDFKNPLNQELLEQLNKMFKSFAPSNSSTMTNLNLDVASLAPKEIRTDYYNIIKQNDEILNRPASELYADMFSSLVKK